jgi:hypothetical protein
MTPASCESPYKTVIAEKIGVLLLMSSRDRTMATVMLRHAYSLGSRYSFERESDVLHVRPSERTPTMN